MNKTLTSPEMILSAAKKMVAQGNLHTLNMRDVARACKVSVGCVYNYFPSKSELMIATIESIWKELVGEMQEGNAAASFVQNVESVFASIHEGCQKYPDFFSMHMMGTTSMDAQKARSAMHQYMAHIKRVLRQCLDADAAVKTAVFDDSLSRDDFISFVFSNVVALWMKNDKDCEILLQIIARAIY